MSHYFHVPPDADVIDITNNKHPAPTDARLHELFVVVKDRLHWRIDATHSAPTGDACNVDAHIMSAKAILRRIGPKLSTGITKQANGQFRARYTSNSKRVHLGYFKTEKEAANAISQMKGQAA